MTSSIRRTALALTVLIFLITSVSLRADLPYFMGLGSFPSNTTYSVPYDISADGSVIVGFSTYSTSLIQPFRWTLATGMQPLAPLGSLPTSVAFGISGDGLTVVGEQGNDGLIWTQSSGVATLPDLPGGQTVAGGRDASHDGSVRVGFSYSASGEEATRWTNAGPVGLGDLPGGTFRSRATGVSGDGSIVVGNSASASGTEAFRWTSAAGMVGLGDLPGGGFNSSAAEVSADGQVIVGTGTVTSGDRAFRWTETNGMVNLGVLPGFSHSIATGVSGDGSFIVGWCDTTTDAAAFRWDSIHGMRRVDDLLIESGVDLSGWTLDVAWGISADGQTLTGYGYYNGSVTPEAWVAHIPEPGTLTLVMIGAGLFLHRRRAGR